MSNLRPSFLRGLLVLIRHGCTRVNTVAPEAVTEGETEDDMMGVDYSKLVPMLVKEIQSLRARVAQLEGEN